MMTPRDRRPVGSALAGLTRGSVVRLPDGGEDERRENLDVSGADVVILLQEHAAVGVDTPSSSSLWVCMTWF